MKILVACEFSGTVRDAFAAKGHDAWSCDILPTESPGNHYQCDLFDVIDKDWDLIIAHPPCTYLTVTGNRWFKPEYKDRFPTREQDRKDAVDFFMKIANNKCPKIAIENPVGVMSRIYRKPDQIIQPYQFGHDESKKTCLWLKGLPLLKPTNIVEPYIIKHKSGRTDSRWHFESLKLPPHERMKFRSKTFAGIASAMSNQWS
jgi:hypothetical protein